MNEIKLAEQIEQAAERERTTGDSCIWVPFPPMTVQETEVANESLRRMGLRSFFMPAVAVSVR